MTQYLSVPVVTPNAVNSNTYTMVDDEAYYADVITADYLGEQQLKNHVFTENDLIYVKYLDGEGFFTMALDSDDVITLSRLQPVGSVIYKDVTFTAAALATAGHVAVQTSAGHAQYKIRDIKVNYSASGLSGGGGDRLLRITDGTTNFNNAGITAAVLGTPVNTVLGGTENPVAGTVAQNTSSVAGATIYGVYAGGTTDFTTGSVTLTIALERVA